MATYSIAIDDSLVIGLQDVFSQANARNIQSRQAPFFDVEAFLTQSVIQTANQGLNNIAQAAAQRVAALAVANDNTITPAKLIEAVEAYAVASPETQDVVRAALGI